MDESTRKRRQSLLRSIEMLIDYLKTMPADFHPAKDEQINQSPFDEPDTRRRTLEYIFSNHFAPWPREVLSQFMHLSFLVANESALAMEDYPHLDGQFLQKPQITAAEESIMFETSLVGTDSLRALASSDPTLRAKKRYVDRHRSTYVPYENLIYTFLGSAAFEYFNLASDKGLPKVQPHEASREEWINLYKIDSQVRIDFEIQTLMELNPNQAKDVVVACWGLAAVMAHLSPSVFLCEGEPYVSSVRNDGGLTISIGAGTRVLLSFRPRSLVTALEFLVDSISKEIFDAADLMWTARSLVEVERVEVPYASETIPSSRTYDVFLSHRGVDAKSALLRNMIERDIQNDVFLDCLSVAEGCVNRLFVYQSLVKSKNVFVIRTEHYDESAWCLKEQALAIYLSSIGRLERHEFTTVSLAWDTLIKNCLRDRSANEDGLSSMEDEGSRFAERRGPLWFICSDLNGVDRTPNRKTLYHEKHLWMCIDQGIKRVNNALDCNRSASESLTRTVIEVVKSLFDAVVDSTKKGRRSIDTKKCVSLSDVSTDVLTVFGEIFFGLISIGSATCNKVEARQAADTIGCLTRGFVKLVDASNDCSDDWREYFYAMIVAVALEFDRERHNELPVDIGIKVCGNSAKLRRRQILFDTRGERALCRFRLRLAVLLIRHGIGTVGIIQSADNLIHNSSIDGFQLNVLPCVTLYPGMASRLNLNDDNAESEKRIVP